MKIDRLDHFVLTVADIERTLRFYADVLGMEPRHVEGRDALHFGSSKINLHQSGREFEPKAQAPTPGSADVCFITLDPLPSVLAQLERFGVEIVEGPVQRKGAMGPIDSVYFRDPDGNLVEVSNYPA